MQKHKSHGFLAMHSRHVRKFTSARLYIYLCFVCIIAMTSIFFLSTSVTFYTGIVLPKVSLTYQYPDQHGTVTSVTSTSGLLSAMLMHYNYSRNSTKVLSTKTLNYSTAVSPFLSEEIAVAFPNGGRSSAEFKDIIRQCSEKQSDIKNPIGYDTRPYSINEVSTCIGQIYVVIAVHSNFLNRKRRNIIRSSWGSIRHVGLHRVVVVFFVGINGNSKDQRLLQEESDEFHDIVQRNFTENYRNMTYKHLTVMRWISRYCSEAEFMIKCDDDTFIDIFHVVHFLQVRPVNGFICKRIHGKPIRNPKSSMRKWLVTKDEYSKDTYPQYCEGFAYIMQVKHAKSLYWCSIFSKFFWIDDVHVTGTLREKLKIPIEPFWFGHSWANMAPSYASEKISDVMFLLASHNEVMPEFWMGMWKAVLRYNFV